MKWLDSARARLRLLFARRAAESRMNTEFRFHIEMETDRLMRAKGLAPDEARRQALAAFGGVEKHKEALRDGRGLAWLSGMSLDVKLGGRMLRKYPGLTLAGGLALAIAIGIGAGWYDVTSKFLAPTIPLPEGDRLVSIETQNVLTNEQESRVVRDFLEWRHELRTVEELGAYRTNTRSLTVGNAVPERIRMAELTAGAFHTARVAPVFGRALLDSDEVPGAPSVIVVGYDVWQRSFGGRQDVVGSVVRLGNTPATVIGVMPDGFGYPVNHDAWAPLPLRASYGALEGGPISVIGRLAPGVTREQADAELRVLGERAAAALPATHVHLRPRVIRLGEAPDFSDIAQLAMTNLPGLLVLILACMNVGTLVYARTATREGEIALRSALGASRGRVIGQLFVEALVLAAIPTAVGLIAADWAGTWVIGNFNKSMGGVPFWITPGLKLSTILYAGGLAVGSAAMLSLVPALKVTRARVQSHLANLGTGGATLRFGRVWTTAMIAQVALTAIAIPGAFESAMQALRNMSIRGEFPSREYLVARLDLDRPSPEEAASAFADRQTRTYGELERRIAQEPGVVAVTFAEMTPGTLPRGRGASVEATPGGPVYDEQFHTAGVGPGFFEAFDRPIVAGRPFHEGDRSSAARAIIVNETFARNFLRHAGTRSPIGARLRYPASTERSDAAQMEPSAAAEASADKWFEIVGVVRDFGVTPDDEGNEQPYVFHAASPGTASPLVMSVRMRSNPAPLVARLPAIAAGVDAGLSVQDAQPLDESIRDRDASVLAQAGALAGVAALVLLMSAMGIFSLMSVSVSRRTREIGLRAALGANPRHLLAEILSRAFVLMGSGITAGGALLLLVVALGGGPTGRSADDVVLFAGYLAVTTAVMLTACLLACIEPARRALRINPIDALRDA
jgi:putative ABC transport system permease protein